jgi:hypothetical protein
METLLLLVFFGLLIGLSTGVGYCLLVQSLGRLERELRGQGLSEAEIEERLREVQSRMWEYMPPEVR